jgi:LCP family protein required for cell wall assembly
LCVSFHVYELERLLHQSEQVLIPDIDSGKNMPQTRNTNSRQKRSSSLSGGIKIAIIAVLAIIAAVTSFTVIRKIVTGWTIGTLPGAPSIDESTLPTTAAGTPMPVSSAPLQPDAGPTPQAWDGSSRVTVLIMGLDYDDTEARRIPRTDSMMVASMDPQTKTAGIMSIPRDTWVNIPGFDYAKINTAYFLGDSYKLPGGGAGLAVQTVESFLGVPINYYAQIDFDAFVKFIDEIGGVDINVPQKIKVSVMGGFTVHGTNGTYTRETKTLKPGVQRLDGATALAYARDRHTDGGDFDRSSRQQQVVQAVREKVLSLNMLPTLIAKAPQLYNDLSSGIHTNLSLSQIVQLAMYASQIPEYNIHYGLLGPDSALNGTSPDGQSILIPLMDKFRTVRDETFATSGPLASSVVSTNQAELVKQEQAKISIHNGSSTTGLAETTGNYFRNQGLNIVEVGNDNLTGSSYVVDITGKPNTISYLASTMNLSTAQIRNAPYDPNSAVDVIVVLGNDWASKNPMGLQ